MNTGGWIVMGLSISFFTGLFVWCIYKVFAVGKAKKMHGFEIEPPDVKAEHKQ